MPLVRFEVRNEYSLGHSELYKEASDKREDPKAVLDGVAVAGLVGILRQLGDLAQFAAEVFHGLQEQVTTTASRSHKLMVRVQNIEAALPSLEKAVLAQTSHIHFAYTAGSEWHSRSQIEQNNFIYNDLPRFILDSYEECCDPPRLHLLDKYDTGGPGSCLKRYSDPTFFRRASGNFKELEAGKVLKGKRVRKTKKKRSSRGNVDILHSASMPNQSARMPNTPTIDGQTSPSRTTSTTDMTLKSDQVDKSNSFTSRTGSAYVECVFHLSSSAQYEEHKSKEFHSRFMHTPDSVIPDELLGVATDTFHQISSPEPIVPGSSCDVWDGKAEFMEPNTVHSDENEAPDMFTLDPVLGIRTCDTWDGKAEVMEPNSVHFDANEAPEMFAIDSVPGIRSGESVDHRYPKQVDVTFDSKNMLKLSIGRNELDQVETEPDKYMDALNTVESDSEHDLHCQMKHEVQQFASILDNEKIEDEVDKVPEHFTGDPSNNKSHITSNLSQASNFPSSYPSNMFSHEHACSVSAHLSNSDNLPGIETSASANALDFLKVEPIGSISDSPSSGCRMSSIVEPLNDKTASSSSKSQESASYLVGVQPFSFWTNGGLLGLEPSKPPDFAAAKALSKSDGEAIHPLNHLSTPSYNGEIGRSGGLIKAEKSTERMHSSKCSSSQLEGQDAELEKTGDFYHSKRSCHVVQGHEITSIVKPGKEQPIDENVRATCTKENEENSSPMFGLGHRLLINGFHRKMPLDPNSEPDLASASSLGADASHQRNGRHDTSYHAYPDKTFNERLGQKTSASSLSSSPPLEHMKISFIPIDGFEASKFNLKFPEGNQSNGSIRDMFPSFQLVPEPTIQLKDAGSDSDDDTFCRSSPYMSDDCRGHHSDSDSEQWESDQSSGNKDHELCDDGCRMPPGPSDRRSVQPIDIGNNDVHVNCENCVSVKNGVDPSLSPSMLDLPSFDIVNPVIPGKSNDNVEARNVIELQYSKDSNPLPPPPPPLQWWATKTDSCKAEDKQNTVFGAHEHELESTVSQQHKNAAAEEICRDEQDATLEPNSKQQDKNNVHRDANTKSDAKGMDESEDFLHQIKTRSFTLRRTVTTKPTFSSGPAANGKVTAILEKAIAIRQAVGTDDGEDEDDDADAWSDT